MPDKARKDQKNDMVENDSETDRLATGGNVARTTKRMEIDLDEENEDQD